MNKQLRKPLALTILLSFINQVLWAQADTTAASVDATMRSHDKIYVVMAVCIIILVVFFLYLIRIDRKVSKKETSA
jgi:hypothetical protein